ncbi:hypothetical protein HPULCUR_001246 [Helicostylum pulchrum]|uniref:Beta-lactamase n=1 Tax=Helicostylum pulchrum TaxID=562976 RepID=A0ABP9XM64_9FUNG
MKIIYEIEEFPNPGDKDLYKGIKEINKNNYQGALYHFEKSSNYQNEYGMLFNAILQFTGFGSITRDPRKAMNIFKTIAYAYNNPVAMFFIGVMYLEGDEGVSSKGKAGIHWLTLAANEGWQYAMGLLGCAHFLNMYGKADHKKALEWFKKAALVDVCDSCSTNDEPYYLFGNKKLKLDLSGFHHDEVQMIHLTNNETFISLRTFLNRYDMIRSPLTREMMYLTVWDLLTDRQSIIVSVCQYYIAVIYFIGTNRVPMDIRRSVNWARKVVKNGNSEASNQLGAFYEFGIGVEENYTVALEYYKQSDCAEAIFRAGTFYFEGKGTERDHAVALAYFNAALSLEGHELSCFFIGKIYKNGKDGVEQDYQRSADCFTMAFILGLPEAATEIGILYRNGLGVQKDNQKAYVWFLKGASMGCPKSHYALGLIHFNGDDVVVDYDKAFTYFMSSHLGGFEPAFRMLTQVSHFVDPE